MRAKAKTGAKKGKTQTQPRVFYHIDSLLRVMRAIEQQEEHLCTILHEIRRSGVVSAEIRIELRDLLAEMPVFEYQEDLIAVREALDLAPPRDRTAVRENKVKARSRKAR